MRLWVGVTDKSWFQHGNAISIMLAEIVLTLALTWASTVPQLILLIALWVLPSTTAWIIGTWLEESIDKAASK